MRQKPVVGQIVWARYIGGRARLLDAPLVEMRVTTVGRKYFECCALTHSFGMSAYLDTWRQKSEYGPDYQLYESPEEREEEKRQSELVEWFKRIFNTYASPKYTLAALEKARAILEADEKGAGK